MYVTADERVEIAQFNVAVTANLAPIPSGVFPKQELAETHIVLGKADFAILLPTLVSLHSSLHQLLSGVAHQDSLKAVTVSTFLSSPPSEVDLG